jgi:hypothetical protein
VLRIKQTNGLNFATALPTSLRRFPILTRRYIEPFFMKFRGPQAPPKQTRKCDGLPFQIEQVMRTYQIALDAGTIVIVEDGGCRLRHLPIQR